MKTATELLVLLAVAGTCHATGEQMQTSPLSKVLDL
eukprot:CAMPEP_0172816134 /NCGR_PEP_ID=MMETSP1075-20121228/12240_1 /TAXON_ID=2916 /ORGANISM="Ceratium fusus, Strain PA161109" /LENGTH=35 /DNA_ID= /DNA_START= /DNA_END= /DNA_ORIENTATION=